MIDLAAFYAAVADEGALPRPHAIKSIEMDGQAFSTPNTPLPSSGAADRTSFINSRRCCRAWWRVAPHVQSVPCLTMSPARPNHEDAIDGWFVGFTNDVTIAVWVGYDNGNGKRRSLGTTATGARVALPIFEPILQAVWAQGIAPKAPLDGPSPEAKRHLVDLPIDYMSGTRINGGGGQAFVEHFRVEIDGKVNETQYQLVSREDPSASRNPEPETDPGWGPWGGRNAGPEAEQGWGAGVGVAMQSRKLSKALVLGVGAVARAGPLIPPQSQQSLQPPQSQPTARLSCAVSLQRR